LRVASIHTVPEVELYGIHIAGRGRLSDDQSILDLRSALARSRNAYRRLLPNVISITSPERQMPAQSFHEL
jgi:hypothetical protein